MTAINVNLDAATTTAAKPDSLFRRALHSGRIRWGGGILGLILFLCLITLPLTLSERSGLYYDGQNPPMARAKPASDRWKAEKNLGLSPRDLETVDYNFSYWFGADTLGRSLLGRCLLGGAISLLIGLAAATISVVLGVSVGLLAGYRGGWIDALLMRSVDILFGLPYVLLIVLFKIALEPTLTGKLHFGIQSANLVVLFLSIGLVSWLTMARVVRGQVLSLRSQPFIEACRACGLPEWRIFTRHLLPNLIGPIIVYATLTVPQAILQESFLSFLGIGIQQPMPTWGALASEGLLPSLNTVNPRWWMLTFPCLLLATTLLSLNFLGDGLRDVFDPKREAAKI
jgi:oligopeptide transport system permease protein